MTQEIKNSISRRNILKLLGVGTGLATGIGALITAPDSDGYIKQLEEKVAEYITSRLKIEPGRIIFFRRVGIPISTTEFSSIDVYAQQPLDSPRYFFGGLEAVAYNTNRSHLVGFVHHNFVKHSGDMAHLKSFFEDPRNLYNDTSIGELNEKQRGELKRLYVDILRKIINFYSAQPQHI